ncbi:MAG: chemotaxis protein [Sulfuricellaceae bacterium]|nr:chemotaxis protein [Sulfuricellaceae bacterium]
MSDLLKRVDARTKLAGTNKLEILLFTLGLDQSSGRKETFGINVFKVREVMRVPEITRAPDMPHTVEGMVSLRGALVPVVDLTKYTGISSETKPEIMIVTEYNSRTQGFLVESVDTILRLDWSEIKVPPEMLTAQMGGLITAVTQLPDGRLVMLMDVEKILSETSHFDEHEVVFSHLVPLETEHTIFFTDDSPVARKQIERTLEALNIRYRSATTGKQAWEELLLIAARAEQAKLPVKNFIQLVLTDVEMPEMDGYILTKNIKSDSRFAGIPVIMHSSLSGASNQELGKSVGVDEYVSKFEPSKLSEILTRRLTT